MVTHDHKRYLKLELLEKSKADSLSKILDRMRSHWPNATVEGSTGLIRSYFNFNERKLIGYAWINSKRKIECWNYIVFKYPQDW